MQRIFGAPSPEQLASHRPVLTLGMFDGVHLGHQAVLAETRSQADRHDAPAVALTFDIHPRRLLAPDHAPAMITSLPHRLLLFQQQGMDATCVLSFTEELARMDAAAFVEEYFVRRLAARAVVLGHDAHFGRDRDGDHDRIRQLGRARGFAVTILPPVLQEGQPVSSTAIRNAVETGNLAAAARMLGRPVSVLGTVVAGEGVGRQLGFPTLNLDPHHELRPPPGVYVTETRCGDTTWASVTNIGHRPTVSADHPGDVLVETHLLDYRGTLYGQVVEVRFLDTIRGEVRFDSREALAEQIGKDVDATRAWFDRRET